MRLYHLDMTSYVGETILFRHDRVIKKKKLEDDTSFCFLWFNARFFMFFNVSHQCISCIDIEVTR